MEQFWNSFTNLFDQNFLVRWTTRAVLGLLALVVFLVVARVLRTTVRRVADRTSNNANLPVLLSNLAYLASLTVGALVILSIFTGSGLANLLTLLGLVSLAFSLSVQDVLKNFVAGVYLLLEQPFSIGDRIKVRDSEGKVENIQIRTTSIHTDEGLLVYIPNNIVFSEVVTNRTAYRQRLNTLRFSIKTEEVTFADITAIIKGVMTGFDSTEVSPDPPAQVLVEAINAEQVNAKLEFWSPISAPNNTLSDVMLALSAAQPSINISGAAIPPAVAALPPPPPVV